MEDVSGEGEDKTWECPSDIPIPMALAGARVARRLAGENDPPGGHLAWRGVTWKF